MDYFRHYLSTKNPKQHQEFIQHMKRYLYMYMPNAGYEIADTRRYGGAGRRVEACVTVTKDWHVGDEMRLCTGMIAHMDRHQEHELKKGNRDISVMWSSRKQCNCLFLGPARFVNHDCDPNAKFIALGQNSITLKVIKEIKCGDEVTAYYGKHYFGENNCECRCATCETQRTGYFTPDMDTMSLGSTDNEDSTTNERRSLRKRKSALHDDYITDHDRRAKRQSLTIPRTTPIELEELIGYIDSTDDEEEDDEDKGRQQHHIKNEDTTAPSLMDVKQDMDDDDEEEDDSDEERRKVMSIHFLCNDQNDKKQQHYQHMTSPRLSPVTHSPLDLLCEVILDAEHIKIQQQQQQQQQQEKEKNIKSSKPKEITVVVSPEIHRDAADRIKRNGSYHNISSEDDSCDTKADSAVGLSPRLQQHDSLTSTKLIKKESSSSTSTTKDWDNSNNNNDLDSLFDDDEQLSELEEDDFLDDGSDLSSVHSSDLSTFSEDEEDNVKLKKSPSPINTTTTNNDIDNENDNNNNNCSTIVSDQMPISPRKKGFSKSKKGSTDQNDSLNCVACGRALIPETVTDPSAADVAVANELATWTWSPSAAFTDWRPKRCPRCERHVRVFTQEWPSRKIKRSNLLSSSSSSSKPSSSPSNVMKKDNSTEKSKRHSTTATRIKKKKKSPTLKKKRLLPTPTTTPPLQ
ncbi:unnamed protein product [Cunninghamella echinulata]